MRPENKLAYFGNKPVFDVPRSTSNLVQPSKEKFLSYLKPTYSSKIICNSGSLISLFEQRFAELHGAKHCIAVCNGLWGLVLTIYCLKKDNCSEVIMPSLTYRRLADIAAWVKLTPYYCDVDSTTLGLTRETAAGSITNNTALILAPHPIVNLCDIDGLIDLANEEGLPLLFDSVESYYADHKGKRIGSFGDAECFSMHASKFINGFEGGYITTNDNQLAEKLRWTRNNGIDELDNVKYFGINAHLTDLHAAFGLASLDEVEDQVEKNKERFFQYKTLLENVDGLRLVEYATEEKRSFKNILVELNSKWKLPRDITLKLLQAENMIVRPYYSPPLHEKETSYATIKGDLKNTNELKGKFMLLPCGEFVNLNDIKIIVEYLDFINAHADYILSLEKSKH